MVIGIFGVCCGFGYCGGLEDVECGVVGLWCMGVEVVFFDFVYVFDFDLFGGVVECGLDYVGWWFVLCDWGVF